MWKVSHGVYGYFTLETNHGTGKALMPFLIRCPILGTVTGISGLWKRSLFFFSLLRFKKKDITFLFLAREYPQIYLLTRDIGVLFIVACLFPHPGVTGAKSSFQRKNTARLDVIRVYHTLLQVFQFIITELGVRNIYTWTPHQLAQRVCQPAVTRVRLLASRSPIGGPLQSCAVFRGARICRLLHSVCGGKTSISAPSSAPTEADLTRAINWGIKAFTRICSSCSVSEGNEGVFVFPVFSQPK